MKKLCAFAAYALAIPTLAFGAGAVKSNESNQVYGQSDSRAAAAPQSSCDELRAPNRGYMSAAPANGIHASNLIGAEVKTSAGENVGPVDDLIIDDSGRIVAVIVGVGGFLGMGEKDVAIGWDDVTRSGKSDDQVLQIESTRDELRAAPALAMRN